MSAFRTLVKPLRRLALLLPFFATGCISLGTFVANLPTYFEKLERRADIAYGPAPQQKLDIYQAALSGGPPRPVVIFLYGGRWSSGSKEQFRFVAARLARDGYLVVIPDYAKYPQVKFPALMDDPARAVAWVSRHIGEYGGDAARLFLMGHSSGAQVGALLISDARYLRAFNASPNSIQAFAGLAGPYDFTPESPDLKDMFGPPERYAQMQAPRFITGREPPMLLLQGAEDETVAPYNLDRLAAAIAAHGGSVTAKIYPGLGHIGIIASFAKPDRADQPIARDCVAFFRRYDPD